MKGKTSKIVISALGISAIASAMTHGILEYSKEISQQEISAALESANNIVYEQVYKDHAKPLFSLKDNSDDSALEIGDSDLDKDNPEDYGNSQNNSNDNSETNTNKPNTNKPNADKPGEYSTQLKNLDDYLLNTQLNITDIINKHFSSFQSEDRSFLYKYDTNKDKKLSIEEAQVLFDNPEAFNQLNTQVWNNKAFKEELKPMLLQYNELLKAIENLKYKNEGDQSANITGNEIEDKGEELNNSKTGDNSLDGSRKLSEEEKKLIVVYTSAAAAFVGIVIGIGIGVDEFRKRRSRLAIGRFNIGKDADEYLRVSKELEKTLNQIQILENKARNSKPAQKATFSKKARDLKKEARELSIRKENLMRKLNNSKISGKEKEETLKFLKKYSKRIAKTASVNHFSEYNKNFAKTLLKKIDEFEKAGGSRNYERVWNDVQEYLKKSNLKLHDKVILDWLSNSGKTRLQSKQDIERLKSFANYLKKSKNVFVRDSAQLVKDHTKLKLDESKGKRGDKFTERRYRIDNKLKELKNNYNFSCKYFGANNVLSETGLPINHNRCLSYGFHCPDMDNSIAHFFDKVSNTYLTKNKTTHLLTVSYEDSCKEKMITCSFDNKEGMDLIKSKIITTIPTNAKNIKVWEGIKTNSSSNVKSHESEYADSSRLPSKDARLAINEFNIILSSPMASVAKKEPSKKIRKASTILTPVYEPKDDKTLREEAAAIFSL